MLLLQLLLLECVRSLEDQFPRNSWIDWISWINWIGWIGSAKFQLVLRVCFIL